MGLCGLSACGVLIGYLILRHPVLIGICEQGGAIAGCLTEPVLQGIARPLYLGTWPLPLFFGALVLLPRSTFLSWLMYFGPVAVVITLLIVSSDPTPNDMGIFSVIDRTAVTISLVRLYVFASLVFIGVSLARHSRQAAT
jgi:hypothetical protein